MPDEVLEVLFDMGCVSAGAVPADDEVGTPTEEVQGDDWPLDPFWLEAGWIDLKGGD